MSFFNFSRLSLLAAMVVLIMPTGCESAPEVATDRAVEAAETVDVIDRRIWFAAAEAGDTETLRTLLEDGIDPLIEIQGLTALHIAARQGYLDAARLLVDAGVDVNIVPNEAQAALASAAGHGSPQMVEMIAGSELDPQGIASVSNRRSPLNLAVENGHADVAELLIRVGADVNAHGEWYSPLYSAVLYGDAAVVGLLLENGSNVNAKTRIQHRTNFSGFRYVRPVELARIIERDDLVELLQRYGGKD